MILSNEQAMYLYRILQDSLTIVDSGDSPFLYSQMARASLAEVIMMQQDSECKDLEKLKAKDD